MRRAIGLQVQSLLLFLFLVQINLRLSGPRWGYFEHRTPKFFDHRRLRKRENCPIRVYPSARSARV
jgi:hypothetical protein